MADEAAEPSPSPLTESEAGELASLRVEMADTRGQDFDGHHSQHYWSNPEKQSRFGELLDREAEGGAMSPAADAERVGKGDVAALAGPAPAAEEAAAYSLDADGLAVAKDTVADIEASFGDAAQEISTAVSGLPDALRVAMVAELGSPYTPSVPHAERADIEAFEATHHGRILATEWGADTARRLGVALHRCQRFEDSLDDANYAQWQDWLLNRLQPAEAAAVLDRLTA